VALSDKIIQGLDSMSVDSERVAGFLSLAGPAIKLKLWRMVTQLLWLWAAEFDAGQLGPDEDSMRIQIASKKLIEFMNKNSMNF
jgi:hypothetical protein